MAFRNVERDMGDRIAGLERRVHALEARAARVPDRGWTLVEVPVTAPDGSGTEELRFLWAPSGALGPTVGTKLP